MPITVKGQVTIPKAIRDHLGVVPGSRVAFEVDQRGEVVLRKAAPASSDTAVAVPDRFGPLMGSGGELRGMPTDAIMRLLRGDDD